MPSAICHLLFAIAIAWPLFVCCREPFTQPALLSRDHDLDSRSRSALLSGANAMSLFLFAALIRRQSSTPALASSPGPALSALALA